MEKLTQWIAEFPDMLNKQYRKGIISLEEFNLAEELHKSVKKSFDSYYQNIIELNKNAE